MSEFQVSPADYGLDDNPEDGVAIQADSDYEAAEKYVDKHFADLDYPDEIKMLVRKIGANDVTAWDVFSYRSYTFCAYKSKPKP